MALPKATTRLKGPDGKGRKGEGGVLTGSSEVERDEGGITPSDVEGEWAAVAPKEENGEELGEEGMTTVA